MKLFYYRYKYLGAYARVGIEPEFKAEYEKGADEVKNIVDNLSEKALKIFTGILNFGIYKFDRDYGDTSAALLEIYRTGLFDINFIRSPYSKKYMSISIIEKPLIS